MSSRPFRRLNSATLPEPPAPKKPVDYAVRIANSMMADHRILVADGYASDYVYEYSFEGKLLRVTLSAGVATFPDDGENRTLLFSAADRALYASKSGGRNQVCT